MLIDLAITLPFFILFALIENAYYIIFKKKTIKEILSFNLLFDFISYFIISIITFGIIHIVFPHTSHVNLLPINFFNYILAKVINLETLYKKVVKKENKEYKSSKFALLGIFIISFILEVSYFNFQGFNQHYKKETISLTSEKIKLSNGAKLTDDGLIYIPSDGTITIDTTDITLKNIYFTFNNVSLNVETYFKTSSQEFSFLTNPKTDLYNYMDIGRVGETQSLQIRFNIKNDHEDKYFKNPDLYLKSITLNEQMPFAFNAIRQICIISLLSLIVFLPTISKKFGQSLKNNDSSYKKLEYGVLCIFGITLLAYLISVLFIFKDKFLVQYSSIDIQNSNIYFQQFDAVMKNRLSLDLPVDDRLIALPNPYDTNSRNGIPYYWDHAFYNGKYYCYYGIAPVILFMLPVYYISGGYIPSIASIQQMGMIISLFSLLLAEIEAVKAFTKKNNFKFTVFLLLCSISLSLTFYITSYKTGYYVEGIYHIPYAYGIANMFLTFFFVLKAYNSKTNSRITYLTLSAVTIVLLVLSRPNLIVTFIFLAPLYLKMLFENKAWKKNIIKFIPCFAIVIVGAIGVMIFNKARFNSFFEFGQSYQLTVTDQTNLPFSSKALISAIFHFYLQLPAFCNSTNGMPFFDASYYYIGMETHPYTSYTIGLFFAPIFLVCFAIPLCFRKEEDNYIKSSIILLLIASLIISTITASYAGICVRYNLDIFPIMAFSTFITISKLFDKYSDNKKVIEPLFKVIIFVLIISTIICFDYIFVRFDGLTGEDVNGLLFHYTSFWGHYNTSPYSNSFIIPLVSLILVAITSNILTEKKVINNIQ